MGSYLIHYDTLLQNVTDIITKSDSYFITKCDKSLLQNASGLLLQSATVITKCDVFYKLRQYRHKLLVMIGYSIDFEKSPHHRHSKGKFMATI